MFQEPTADLTQGDLFGQAPAVYVKDLDFLIRLDARRFQLQTWKPAALKLEDLHPENAVEEVVQHANAVGVRRHALLLTHGCEIDKNPRRASMLLAIVRPLAGVPEDHRDGFRNNTRPRAFYLPPSEFLGGEYYADLRAVTTIRRDALEQLDRVASMSEDGQRMLQEQIFRFFTRRVLPADWVTWDEEDEEDE